MKLQKLAGLAAIAPLGLVPISAGASFYTGTQLYAICTAEKISESYIENTYECIAYITGAVDAFNTRRDQTRRLSCIPSGVTISELRAATVGYLRDNPMKRDESAAALVFAATRTQWPCGKK